jgi:hypothetical protein
MSLNRLIFYGAFIGGWAAFVGWLLAELLFVRGDSAPNFLQVMLMTAAVGAAIAGGLSMVGSLANAQWQQMLVRVGPALLGGLIAGAVGGLIGEGFYQIGLPRVFGWLLMGLAIGAVEGVYDRSPRKLRNGLIGGAVGGFVGGLLFGPITQMMQSGSGLASRATAFVILGMCIGLLIAVVQVVLKQAWLTVVEGFRPGRQLILAEGETLMGTAEKCALPFIAFGAKGVEPRHVRIYRQPDGSYVVMDNGTRTGTRVNGRPLAGPVVLRDGDVIQFGVNAVRFSERRRGLGVEPVVAPPRPAMAPMPVQAVPVQPVMVQPVGIQAAPAPLPAIPIQPRGGAAPAPPMVTPIRPAQPPGPAPIPAPIPVRPVAQPPAPPPQQRPPVAPPPQQRPPLAQPPAAQPPMQQRPPAAPPAPAQPGGVAGLCPNCGIKATGAPGARVCMICGMTF